MSVPYRPDPQVVFPPTTDEKNLGILAIFHYIVGALLALGSCVFIIYIVLGVIIVENPDVTAGSRGHPGPPADLFGGIFIVVGAAAVILGWSVAGAMLYAGRCINLRQRHLYCCVVAGLSCLWVPFGTVLGVFTLVLLTKAHIRALFIEGDSALKTSR